MLFDDEHKNLVMYQDNLQISIHCITSYFLILVKMPLAKILYLNISVINILIIRGPEMLVICNISTGTTLLLNTPP